MAEIQISLAAARVNAGMTQEDVAKIMKVSKNTLVNWEKGRTELKPAEFEMMCNIYGISKNYIFLPQV